MTDTAALQTTRFEVKKTSTEKRQFTGLASTWDLDYGGDLITPGAYARTLKEGLEKGRTVPLVDQHTYGSVRSVVGKMLSAKETKGGLEATFQVVSSPEGDEYLARVKEGMIDGLSIGYETRGWREPDEDEKKSGVERVLTDVELREVSLVIWGMNPNALINTASVKTIASTIAGMKRETLTDDDKKMLRQVASLSGALLRPLPPPEESADAELKTDDAPDPPEAPPGDTADAQKAEADHLALRDELLAFQIKQTLHAVTC
jgi:uncharacterized protein